MADHLVALTGGRLEPGAVGNRDSPADIPDEPRPLEHAGGCVDGGPSYPEHLAHELLCERELVPADSIMRHEQPAGEPRLDGMGSIARRRLGQQGQECVGVTQQHVSECGLALDVLSEVSSAHAQGVANDLAEYAAAGDLGVEEHGQTEHPLATNRGNLDRAAFVENGHDGEDRIDGEVHVCQRLVWLIDRLLEGRPDRVDVVQQPPTDVCRQTAQQTILAPLLRLSVVLVGLHTSSLPDAAVQAELIVSGSRHTCVRVETERV